MHSVGGQQQRATEGFNKIRDHLRAVVLFSFPWLPSIAVFTLHWTRSGLVWASTPKDTRQDTRPPGADGINANVTPIRAFLPRIASLAIDGPSIPPPGRGTRSVIDKHRGEL